MESTEPTSTYGSRLPSPGTAAAVVATDDAPAVTAPLRPEPRPRTRAKDPSTSPALSAASIATPLRRDGSLKAMVSADHAPCLSKMEEMAAQFHENETLLQHEIAALKADRETLKKQLRRNSMEQLQLRSLTAADGTPMDLTDLEAFQAKSDALMTQIHHLSEENKRVTELLQEITAKHDALLVDRAQLAATVQESRDRLAQQSEANQISMRNQFHNEYKTVIDTLEAQVKSISGERDQLRRELQDGQQTTHRLEKQLGEMESRFNDALAELTSAKRYVEDNELRIADTKAELEHLKSQNEQLSLAVQQAQTEKEQLALSVQQAQNEMKQLIADKQSASKNDEKLFALETQLENVLRDQDRAEKALSDEVALRHSLTRRLEETERDRDALSEQSEQFLREIKDMESQLKHGTRSLNEVDRLEEKVQELMVERDMLKTSLADTKQQYENTHQQLQGVKDECEQLRAANAKLSDARDVSAIEFSQQTEPPASLIEIGQQTKTSASFNENAQQTEQHMASAECATDLNQHDLTEMESIRTQYEDSQRNANELQQSMRILQEQLTEKEKILYQAKSQYMRRLSTTESSLQEKSIAVEQLTRENDELMGQLQHLQQQITAEPDLKLVETSREPPAPSPSREQLTQLEQQLELVKQERDSLVDSQKSLLQRQLEQVNERDRLEMEIDGLRKQLDALAAPNTEHQRRPSGSGRVGGWLRGRSGSASSTDQPADSIDGEKNRQQIQLLMADHEAAEAQLKQKLQELQHNLNELLVAHDTAKTDHEHSLREKDEQIAKAELEIKKLTDDYERQLTDKEQEMGHLKRLHFYYGKIRRQYRNNDQPTVFEEPEGDGEEGDAERSAPIQRTTLSASSQTPIEMLEDARHQLTSTQKEVAFSGDPFDMDVDPESARRLQHVRLPFDVPTLHQHIHKLLVTITHLRETLKDAQGELKRLQFENDNLKDDLVHVNTVLEQDRQSAHQSISDWENWANEVQASYSTGLKSRDDQIEMLKAELELAKEEWGQIVWDKENTILHLTESRRQLVQQLFEECSLRLNSMQKVMESILTEDEQVHQELTVVNLEKRKRDSIVHQLFGELDQNAVLKRRSANLDVNSLLNEYIDEKERSRQRRNSTGSSAVVSRADSTTDDASHSRRSNKRWSFWN